MILFKFVTYSLLGLGFQILLARALRKAGFELNKFEWVVYLLLNLEWSGHVVGFFENVQSYLQHLKDSEILETSPNFPFVILESILFIVFYTGLSSQILRSRFTKLKFWVLTVKALLVLGVLGHVYRIYIENFTVQNPAGETSQPEWITIGVMFGLNFVLTVLFFRLIGRFRYLKSGTKTI